MSDNVAVSAGTGTTIAADEVVDGTLGTVKVQYVKLMDGTLDGITKATVGANGLKVDGSGATQPVSGTVSANATLAAETTKVIGTVNLSAAQTLATVTNLAQLGGAAVSMGTGVRGAGVQRVTVSTDDVVPASQSGNWSVRNVGNAGGIMDFAGQNAAAPASSLLIGGEFNTTPTTITNGNASPLQMDAAGNLLVNIKAGAGSGGTAIADEAAFTEGTTSFTPIGGVFKTSQTALTTGQAGAVALTAAREMMGLSKLWDGTTTVPILAASSGAPAATVPAIPVSIRDVNPNSQAVMASSAPVTIASDQKWQTGMSPRGFSSAFSTLTRPANTTAYTAGDSISDNATAASVTALSAIVSDTNDDPVTITEILVTSTDTGLSGKRIRALLFNSDPTASTGVGGGDNAAYSQKKAGYIGSMSGVFESGFSDGSVGRLVPSFNDAAVSPAPNAAAGGFIVTKPTSGAKTIFIQYQAIDGFTPSANSTTIIGTVRGFQGRAA